MLLVRRLRPIMLFAEAEGFWKSPNFFDVAGVLGLVVGIVSIWLTWWLAKRDIEKRLTEATKRASLAARNEVRRVAQAVLQSGVADAIRSLELAREACAGKRWPRAAELSLIAREQLTRSLAQPMTDDATRTDLGDVAGLLQGCITQLRSMARAGAGETPVEVLAGLDDSLLALHRAEGRITGIRVEDSHGQ